MTNQKKFFNGQERRKFVRVETPLQTKMKLVKSDNSQVLSDWQECVINNIGCGGVCVWMQDGDGKILNAITDKSNIFEFEITLPLPEPQKIKALGNVFYVKTLGEIVWNNTKKDVLELGVKFSYVSSKNEKMIADFIVQKYVEKYGKKK